MTSETETFALEKRLARERRIRAEAEKIAEQATRKLYERQQELVFLEKIADAANRAESVEEAIATALELICAYSGWPVGHAYLVDAEVLVPSDIWFLRDPDRFRPFCELTRTMRFVSGIGLPGRALESKEPTWLPDVLKAPWFVRVQEGDEKAEIRAGFALPVLAGQEVVAVLEFYFDRPLEPKQALMRILAHAGTHLGRVVERQRAATVERLSVERAALERSNRELEQFAYVASHDLQEPLRKVDSFGGLLANRYDAVLGDDGRDYLRRMRSAARRMQQLIRDLLSYSLMTTRPASFVEVDLAVLAREALSDLELRIENLGARIDIGPLPTLTADPRQIRQLFQNLIANALKFRRSGVVPQVSLRSERRNEGWCVSVADNGIGFEEHHQETIFQPFQRLHGRREYEGSGIGLAICQRIVDQHGGTIRVTSRPGHGTTFYIDLPLRPARQKLI